MRFLAGLRFVLIAAALIGLLAGPAFVAPVAAAHDSMTIATVDAGHDCCGAASRTDAAKTGLTSHCLGLSCSMVATAMLPSAPGIVFSPERSTDEPTVSADLEGRTPSPPLEPPRA